MAKRGRKPKPTALKKFEGTYRADRHRADEPQPEAAEPVKPFPLDATGDEAWAYVVTHSPPGLLTRYDSLCLWLYCATWSEFWKAVQMANDYPLFATSKTGALYVHPVRSMKDTLSRQVSQLGTVFGMSPACRKHLRNASAGEHPTEVLRRMLKGDQ